jgi:hypothetical protein
LSGMDGSILSLHLWMFRGYKPFILVETDVELFRRQGIWVYEFIECAITRCMLNYHRRYPLFLVPQSPLSLDSDPWNTSLSRRSWFTCCLRCNHVHPTPPCTLFRYRRSTFASLR